MHYPLRAGDSDALPRLVAAPPRWPLSSSCTRHALGKPPQAFTLVELLAIISIVALLMSVMVSGFSKTSVEGKSVRSINNHRQLMTAWRMYAADNAERVIYNFGVPQTEADIANGTYHNWANNIVTWGLDSATTNMVLLQAGIFAPYFGANITLYKCPADNFLSSVQVSAGWTARTRSISMSGFFGPFSLDPSDITYSGRSYLMPNYRQWLRISEVPHPANTYVLLDEHPDSINDGYFVIPPTGATSWGDLPASLHDGGCTLGFADGHEELHKWLSKTSKLPVRFVYSTPVFDSLGRMDYQWLASRLGAVPYQ